MSYQVLARKLRPKDFASLVGQEHVVRALCNGLDSGRVHHAYLFTGTRGVGKTTIARILAKSLNCEGGVSSKPCGDCSVCQEIQENRFVDLLEVDAASRTRVDDTRELLDNAQYRPARGRYKVYLIDEVHMLSASSFNALLKTLEEPPAHVKFLLATTDPRKVPVTVLSRCLQFQLRNISREEIARYLEGVLADEGLSFDAEALNIIAKAARGSMRDALSIADQAIAHGQGALRSADVAAMLGLAGRDETAALIEALASGSPSRVLDVSEALADKSVDFAAALADLLEALHGMAANQALRREEDGPLAAEAVQLYYQIALLGYRDLHVGPDPKTCFEMTLLRMLAFAPDARAAAAVPRAEPDAEADSAAEGSSSRPATECTSHAESSPVRTPAEEASHAKGSPSRPPAGGSSDAEGSPSHSPVGGSSHAEGSPSHTPVGGSSDAEGSPSRSPAGGSSDAEGSPSHSPAEGSSHAEGSPSHSPAEGSSHAESSPSRSPAEGSLHARGSPSRSPADGSWHQLVEGLELDGIGRAIVEHSLPVEQGAERLRLVLDRNQGALLDKGQVAAIEKALRGRLGQGLQLSIEVGELAGETPAQRKARLSKELQAEAERRLREDGLVQSLISTFDGRLVDVKPVASLAQGGVASQAPARAPGAAR